MDSILSELQTRLKSPFFAYFLVSFVAFNWDPLFVLFFDSGLVSYRVEYFRDVTDFWSAVVCPFSLAALYMVGYPWLQFGFLKINTKATSMQSHLKIQAEHHAIVEKSRLETERNKLLEQREAELIERAKRDEKVKEIEDKERRKKLQEDVDKLRESADSTMGSKSENQISPEQETMLRILARNGGSAFEENLAMTSPFNEIEAQFYLEDMVKKKILRSIPRADGRLYEMNTPAKQIVVEKKLLAED